MGSLKGLRPFRTNSSPSACQGEGDRGGEVHKSPEIRFIVDHNVGKLAKWLRIMGYDSLLFRGADDGKLIDIALREGRVILTKDTQLMKRRVITGGRLKAILIEDDNPEEQLRQVVKKLALDYNFRLFSLCLECNQPLIPRTREEVQGLVPPYVYRTQDQYMQCPTCPRIYWRGTHWQAMIKGLSRMINSEGL